jgi:putative glutamine amidotransferase
MAGGAERSTINTAYLRSVTRAGGIPLLLAPVIPPRHAAALVQGLDGLLLTGGEDVDPACYHQEPIPELERVDPERDAFELALFRAAWNAQVPTLAICRGQQLVNVALGGTLWQDLPSQVGRDITHSHPGNRTDRSHSVAVHAGSRLARALQTEHLEVNSFHHQAIRDLAPPLRASGLASDGIIEGVETDDASPWVLGVQWHPEEFYREEVAPDAGLFEALVRKAAS